MLFSSLRVIETIFAFALVVAMVLLLKKKKIISVEELKPYTKLMTTAILPSVIFLELAVNPVHDDQFILVMIMFLSGLMSMILAWGAGRLMKLPRGTLGMLMITSSFGSSALIGYPLIEFAFPDNPKAMTDAIMISELGVGVPIFTLCPLVASYFGSGHTGYAGILKTVLAYLRSPIFIAVLAGLLISQFQVIVKHPFLEPFWEALRMVQGTLSVLAALILGLQLRFSSIRKMVPLFIVSALIQIGIQPLLAQAGASAFHVDLIDREVLTLISAMPSAVLCTVFTTQYDCDAERSSELVFLNILASLIGIPLVYYGLFH